MNIESMISSTFFDKFLKLAGWVFLFLIWVIVLINYGHMPDTIPTHYDAAGEVDGYGEKASIFTLPVVATILYFVLGSSSKYAIAINYPKATATEEHIRRHVVNVMRLLDTLKVVVVVIFTCIVYKDIQIANGQEDGLGRWFLIVVLAALFVPILLFLINSFGKKAL